MAVFPRKQAEKFTLETEEKNGIHRSIVYYRSLEGSVHPFKLLIKQMRYLKACKMALESCESVIGKIDLVHLNVVLPLGFFAVYLKRKRNIPFVVTEHATAYAKGEKQYPPKMLKRASFTLKRAHRILPVSQDLGNTLRHFAPGVPQTVVSNVVNEEIFQLSTREDSSRKRFVHISTAVDHHKNVTGILLATAQLAKQNHDFELVIVSDGDLGPHRETMASFQLEDHVRFLGTQTTEQVAEILASGDALVLFSNYENFPCVIAESMMAGVPTISTDVNGIPEHVHDWNGILLAPKDVDALVAAMESVRNGTFQSNKAQLREYALKHFSYEGVGKHLDQIYRIVLREHAG